MNPIYFYVAIIVGLLIFTPMACSNKDGAKAALEKMEYTDIQMRGYSWLGCARDDVFKTKFSARNKDGRFVYGTACKGLFSGYYVREQ